MIPLLPKFSFYLLFLLLVSILPVSAASVLSVGRISFDKVGREDWLRYRLQISCAGNPSESAINPRFLDGVKVRVFLSFRDSIKDFSFYSCEVEIVTLQQGEKYLLDFFLPGSVVKRDRLSTNPFAYLVEFAVGEHPIPFESEFGSTNMNHESARQMFNDKAEAVKAETDGILIPSYFAPVYLTIEDEEAYPAFRRRVMNF